MSRKAPIASAKTVKSAKKARLDKSTETPDPQFPANKFTLILWRWTNHSSMFEYLIPNSEISDRLRGMIIKAGKFAKHTYFDRKDFPTDVHWRTIACLLGRIDAKQLDPLEEDSDDDMLTQSIELSKTVIPRGDIWRKYEKEEDEFQYSEEVSCVYKICDNDDYYHSSSDE